MKKTFLIFLVFMFLVSVLVNSCSTKNDPEVPNHTTNIFTGNNTVNFKLFQYVLDFKSCYIDSVSHYVIKGIDLDSHFSIEVHLFDSVPSTLTYNVINATTSATLNNGECFIALFDPTTGLSEWRATGGTLNLSSGGGNISATVKDIPVNNISDTTKTSFISGSWGCH